MEIDKVNETLWKIYYKLFFSHLYAVDFSGLNMNDLNRTNI